MAWQLIYTSAPKLLEAGRTGFGTVARHRSVSGLLATSVERLSQFARLPGHDPKRIVYCHRIVTVGGSDYHVLSCLRDAGSDYTGRTNHIAHHLVAESREIAPLIDAGITPGDVLRAMPWRSEWTESARYFDAAEEVNLGALKSSKRDAWRSLSGNAEHARLPWADTAARGCYFVTPPELDLLPLLSESLDEKIAVAWQTTFTTNLEPNDDVADFKWIGLPVASPLRSMAEASARPLFDLSSPATLPPPPARPAAPVEVAPAPSAVTSATTAAFTIPAPSLAPVRSGTTFTPGNNRRKTIDLGQSWAPEAKKEKPTGRMPVVAAVVLGLMAIGGIYVGINHFKVKGEYNAYIARVELIFSGWNLPEIKKEIADWKPEQRTEKLETIQQILRSVEEPTRDESVGLFGKGNNLLLKSSVPYDAFAEAAKAWIKAEKDTRGTVKMENSSSINLALKAWKDANDALASLNAFRTSDRKLLASATFLETPAALHKATMELLVTDTISTTDQAPASWKKLVEDLAQSGADRKDEAPWLREWFDSADQPEKLATLNMPSTAPQWIKDKVENEKKNVAKADAATKPTEVETAAVDTGNSENLSFDPDSSDAKHPISLVVIPAVNDEGNDSALGVAELVVDEKQISKEMELFVWGGNVEKDKVEKWSYNQRLSETQSNFVFTKSSKSTEDTKAFIFKDGRMIQIPIEFRNKICRLVGVSGVESDKSILFEVRVIKAGETKPIFPETIEYFLVLKEWKLPSEILDSNISEKEYTIEIRDPDQKLLANRLGSLFQKKIDFDFSVNGQDKTMAWTSGNKKIGTELVNKIKVLISKIIEIDKSISVLEKERSDEVGKKANKNDNLIQNRTNLITQKKKIRDPLIEEIKILRNDLSSMKIDFGEGILKFEKTPIIKAKLTLVQPKQ